ncbi:hypothetical protein SAMN05421827_105120 [Pedobacter terrae]|uniref:HD domain-containing protein n=1 Tax=Pedobacter terrae TaxID=405671 RepID=A0A1G7TBA6_9SPHI|nr:hypothetical protein [Pedobacter terrae]SDG31870.1 hypothetical protein SAMN05421827_105120 [Pedobacter terrae]
MNTKTPINVHDSGKGMFNTRSGLLVDFNNPKAEMIISEDIAHALSRICRFGGHTLGHYSVAAHSLLVAALAPEGMKLEALMHDAAEAYVGDVIKPLKNLLGEVYESIEHAFESVIIEKYYLDGQLLKEIKKYDRCALEMEHAAYIKDDLSAYHHIHSLIVSEIGGNFQQYQLPEIFMCQLDKYQQQRLRNMEAPDNIYFI